MKLDTSKLVIGPIYNPPPRRGLFGDYQVEGKLELRARLTGENHRKMMELAPKCYKSKNVSYVVFEDKLFRFDKHIKRRRVRHKAAYRYWKFLTETFFKDMKRRGFMC
jgi:hypothetical protein